MFISDDPADNDLFNCAPPSFESSLLFDQQFLGLTFQLIKDNAQHDFAGITDEADG
ncbi:hypothetical protein DPMN_138626 [Dreissena polymorpha]|uniref:Uncharacterized protein n=1 Tax=Dreissena polymorpha TaxID=45954 RepID=A0A9D4G7J5_DREPO|nr:hypothetical protein DPMN_138626 [Dreissena polymorpha]